MKKESAKARRKWVTKFAIESGWPSGFTYDLRKNPLRIEVTESGHMQIARSLSRRKNR